MNNNFVKEATEFLIDILRIFSVYVFYRYYHSFWLTLIFFILTALLDTTYILCNIDMNLTDIAVGDRKRVTDKMLNKINEKYWQLFPVRMGIILGSIVIIDILNKGILHA